MRLARLLICSVAACGAPSEPSYSTTAQEAVVISPPISSFGSVTIGTTSQAISFVVSPAGSGESDDTVTAITGCPPTFAIQSPLLPAQVFRHCGVEQEPTNPNMDNPALVEQQVSCTSSSIRTLPFTATFSPTAAGFQTCNGVVQMTSGTQSFSMNGTGALPNFVINVSPRSINFGDIDADQESDARVVTVRNLGGMKLSVGAVVKGDTTELKLTSANGPTHDLDPGEQEDFLVTCTPTDPVPYSGTLDITSNDPDDPLISVALACNGILSSLDISPDAFDVNTLVGAPKTSSVIVKNDGTVPGQIKFFDFEVPNPKLEIVSGSLMGLTLIAGEERTVDVRYTPTVSEDEGELGKLVVTFDNDAPRAISISGGAKIAKVGTEPNLLDFGPVCAGFPTTKHIDVFAGDQGEFDVMGSSTAAPFDVAEKILPTAFTATPPGTDRTRFNVTVEPTPGTTDDVTGALAIVTTSPGEESFVVPLTAKALAAGITALPAELPLGAIPVDELSNAQTVTFTNCSMAPVTIMDETIGGIHADDFVLTKAFMPRDVQPAETVGIDVLFKPTGTGSRQATLAITFTGGTTEVILGGDGIGVPNFRDTYYACSSGGDAGWPILGGVIAIALRRRRRRV